jgi:hypothetical protein
MYNEGVRKARLNDARPEIKSLDGMNRPPLLLPIGRSGLVPTHVRYCRAIFVCREASE